ncbi:MAG: CpaF family protein [Actinomycetota bacterium]
MNATVSPADAALKQRVHGRLLADVAVGTAAPGPSLREVIAELVRREAPLLTEPRHCAVVEELVHEVAGLGPLQPLLADPTVTEVMVNAGRSVYVERAGRVEPVPITLDPPTTVRLVERIIGPLGLRLDRAAPVVDARLPDGSRLHAVIPPLAVDGPCLTIRRFTAGGVDLGGFGVSAAPAAYLRWAVAHGANVVVSGSTSAGKTTLCNTLAGAVPPTERIVTIEETAELRLPLPHVIRLEARLPNAEGAGGVTVRDLVRAALRMRPDRLVVGEVRGGEAFDLLQACNTGHDGSLTTVHANGIDAVLDRLTGLVLSADTGLRGPAVRGLIAEAFDLVVHVARRDGTRRVQAIGEIRRAGGVVHVVPLFTRVDGDLVAVGPPTRATRRPDVGAPDARWFR